MIVIDASAVLEILAGTPSGLALGALLSPLNVHAPHLIDVEVLSSLRRWERHGVIRSDEAERLIDIFRGLAITRHPHTPLIDHVWSLRHNLSAYDASYLALAQSLGAKLLTMDKGLKRVAARHLKPERPD